MQLSTTPAVTLGRPCIRDYSQLVTTVVPESVAALVPLPELSRRLKEVVRKDARYAEEAPIYYQNEVARRAAYATPHIR